MERSIFLCLLQDDALLSEKVQQLSELAAKQTVIHFDSRKFNSYVKSTSRNYSVFLMLTTLHSHRQCHFCRLVYYIVLTTREGVSKQYCNLVRDERISMYIVCLSVDKSMNMQQSQISFSTVKLIRQCRQKRKGVCEYEVVYRIQFILVIKSG